MQSNWFSERHEGDQGPALPGGSGRLQSRRWGGRNGRRLCGDLTARVKVEKGDLCRERRGCAWEGRVTKGKHWWTRCQPLSYVQRFWDPEREREVQKSSRDWDEVETVWGRLRRQEPSPLLDWEPLRQGPASECRGNLLARGLWLPTCLGRGSRGDQWGRWRGCNHWDDWLLQNMWDDLLLQIVITTKTTGTMFRRNMANYLQDIPQTWYQPPPPPHVRWQRESPSSFYHLEYPINEACFDPSITRQYGGKLYREISPWSSLTSHYTPDQDWK